MDEQTKRDRRAYHREYYRLNKEKFKDRYQENRTELIKKQVERNRINRAKKSKVVKIKKTAEELDELCQRLRESEMTNEDILKILTT